MKCIFENAEQAVFIVELASGPALMHCTPRGNVENASLGWGWKNSGHKVAIKSSKKGVLGRTLHHKASVLVKHFTVSGLGTLTGGAIHSDGIGTTAKGRIYAIPELWDNGGKPKTLWHLKVEVDEASGNMKKEVGKLVHITNKALTEEAARAAVKKMLSSVKNFVAHYHENKHNSGPGSHQFHGESSMRGVRQDTMTHDHMDRREDDAIDKLARGERAALIARAVDPSTKSRRLKPTSQTKRRIVSIETGVLKN